MKNECFFSASQGGYSLHTVTWLPDRSPPRAVLHIVHGISEYIDRYHNFATCLTRQGFAVVGCDLPGHGRTATTPETQGHFADEDGWRLVTESLYELHLSIRKQYSGLPCFLMGHSMGSFLVRTMMAEHPGLADGILLSGTGQPKDQLLQVGHRLLCFAVSRRGPGSRSKRLQGFILDAYQRIVHAAHTEGTAKGEAPPAADPRRTYLFTVGLLRDMVEGLLYLGDPAHLAKVDRDTPILFFSGDHDPVGDHGEGVRRVCQSLQRAGCQQITLKLYPDGHHEMLNEPNHLEVYADILHWLNRQMEENDAI